jgi:hypothetical protein
MKIEKATKVSMRSDPNLNEKWLQDQIAQDPSLLNLGNLILKDVERKQASKGRLDMLFEDPGGETRYTVELQLGATDETHIIRTIEYWDIERNRYPNYEHVAVIVAEEITSRFFNVINLFNRQIPLIAIQMSALKVADVLTLHATTVLDLAQRPEEEEAEYITADRDYWTKYAGAKTMQNLDKLYEFIKEIDPEIEISYKVSYVGISRNGKVDNYILCRPRKNHIGFNFKIPKSEENDALIEGLGFSIVDYKRRYGRYVIILKTEDLTNKSSEIKKIIQMAKEYSRGNA